MDIIKRNSSDDMMVKNKRVFQNEISESESTSNETNKSESNESESNKSESNNEASKNETNKNESESEAIKSESETESESDEEDSYSEELTDVSEKFADDDGDVEDGDDDGDEDGEQVVKKDSSGTLHIVPQINVMDATDISTSDDSAPSSKPNRNKTKIKKNLLEQLHESNAQLQEEMKKSENLEAELHDERDAKEQVENDLSELQQKFDRKTKDSDELVQQLHKKDELNSLLETKELELMQEVIDLKQKISENLDIAHDAVSGRAHDVASGSYDIPSHLHSLNEELKTQLRELQSKLASSETLLAEKSAHVESLEREIVLLKEKIENNVRKDDELTESERLEVNEIKAKVESMVAEVIDDSHRKVRIKELEDESVELKAKLKTNEEKYATDMAEALTTLKQVQDAYGDMRDIVLEEYKNEVAHLTDRVRIAEENSNETIITGLRQELLDSRLQHERMKQAYEEEKENQRKALLESEVKQKQLSNLIERMKLDLEAKTEQNKNIQSSLQKNQMIADERKDKITELSKLLNELASDTESMKGCINEKDDDIVQLKTQLTRADEVYGKEHAEKEALQMEVDVMESVKRQNQRLEDEVQEMSHKVKLRGTKIKFLKKHVKELEKQKQKAESIMLAIPDMQRKIDELTDEKTKLHENIITKKLKEEEEKRKIAQEKKQEQIRIHKEKEEWERRILGIGKCFEFHEEENDMNKSDVVLTRPSSAPLLKPRPPSTRRNHPSKNSSKSTAACAPTLNPSYLQSYPQGIKTTQKMKQRHEKAMLSQSLSSSCGRFSSVTKPISYANASYKHIAGGKNFPNISTKLKNGDGGMNPRVLVWGDADGAAGSKMLAVGDHILTNIHSECSTHGHLSKQQSGVVRFIGFVSGNEDDVYVGVRLQEDIGYTDGTIQGKRYFRCEPEKGAFVHLNNIVKILQTQTKHVPSLTM